MTAPQNPHQPPQYAPPPPQPAPPRKMPVWGWVIVGVLALFVIGSVGNDDATDEAASSSAPPTSAAPLAAAPLTSAAAPATAVPVPVTLPDVEGRNGAIVYDELVELGLTNFQLASQDTFDTVVLLPQNWTAVSIEPGPGETVMSNDTVVVTMTKE